MPPAGPARPGRPLRVLYVLPTARIGGAETASLNWIRHHTPGLAPAAVVGGRGPLGDALRRSGVPVVELAPWRQRQFLAQAWATARVIRRQGIDLVHSSMLPGHLVGGLAAALTGRPAICFNHGPIGAQWLQGICPLFPAARVLVPSDHMRREQARTWFNTRRVECVPLGIEVERFTPPDAAARRAARLALDVPEAARVIGLFGRLVPLKGHRLLLHALAALPPERGRPLVLLCVGGDAGFTGEQPAGYRAEIAALAEELRDRVRVILTGFREDVVPLYDATDLVVNASTVPETFGLVVAEAMLKARTVLVPDRGAPAEFVREGDTGFHYALGDVDALAAGLQRALAASPEVGVRARRAMLGRVSLRESVRQLEAHYQAVAAPQRAAAEL